MSKLRRVSPKRADPAARGEGGRKADSTQAEHAAARDHAVIAAALDPILTIDAFGIIKSASDSVFRVFGWTPAELFGQNVSLLMPEPHRSAHDCYLANYRRTGRSTILGKPREFHCVHKNGVRFPVELSISRVDPPLPGNGGLPLFVGIVRDVSERKRSEERLEDYRRSLEEKVRERSHALQDSQDKLRMADRLASIGTLAAGLGHDMNNVLLPIRAHLNALKAAGAKSALPATGQKHVEAIAKSVAYLQQLADGLHFLAMDPESDGDQNGAKATTDVRRWWSQTGVLIAKAVPKHVRVTASIRSRIPEVVVASHRLTQAMLNLVVNAGEAIPPPAERRQPAGHIRIWAEDDPAHGEVRLGVTDNGRGMPREVERRAFEMFFTTKTRGLGTGLGLALVSKVAEGAGGRVELQTAVGKGTTVVLVLKTASARGSARASRPAARVSVRDSRASTVIQQILGAGGAEIVGDAEQNSDVWVTEPGRDELRSAQAWRAAHPAGRLVLFGAPDRSLRRAWDALGPIHVDEKNDFDDLRRALGLALAEA